VTGPRGRHEIRAINIYGSWCWHALRLGPDEWIYTGPGQPGMIYAPRQSVITALADLIMTSRARPADSEQMTGPVIRIESSYRPGMIEPIDAAGNTWAGREYLPPDKYLPLMVPEDDDSGG